MLEKILEEIDKATDEDGMISYFDNEPVILKTQAKEIVQKYMDDGWISVEERLPEIEYDTVLCVTDRDYYFVAVYTKEDGFKTEDWGVIGEIAEWHPLPERNNTKISEETKEQFEKHIYGRFMKVR